MGVMENLQDGKYSPFAVNGVLNTTSKLGSFASSAVKGWWNSFKQSSGIKKGFMALVGLVGLPVLGATYLAVSALVTTVGAVTAGIIGGGLQTLYGLGQVGVGLVKLLSPFSKDRVGGARLLLKGAGNFFKGALKVVVGSAVAGAVAVSAASIVGAPAIGAIAPVSAALGNSIPVIGGAISNVVGAGVAAANAGIVAANASIGIANTALALGPVIASTVTLGPVSLLGGLGVGARAVASKIAQVASNIAQKVIGTSSSQSASEPGQNIAASTSRFSESLQAQQQSLEKQRAGHPGHSQSMLPQNQAHASHSSSFSEQQRLAAPQIAGEVLQRICTQQAQIDQTVKRQNSSNSFSMQNNQPTFTGKNPIEALQYCGNEDLQGLDYTLTLPPGSTVDEANQLLQKAGESVKITKVVIQGHNSTSTEYSPQKNQSGQYESLPSSKPAEPTRSSTVLSSPGRP